MNKVSELLFELDIPEKIVDKISLLVPIVLYRGFDLYTFLVAISPFLFAVLRLLLRLKRPSCSKTFEKSAHILINDEYRDVYKIISHFLMNECDVKEYKYDADGRIYPDFGKVCKINFKNNPILITTFETKSRLDSSVVMKIESASIKIIDEFIEMCDKSFIKNKSRLVFTFKNEWKSHNIKIQKNMKNIFLNENLKVNIFEKIRNFELSEEYYKSKGIPYKLGFLFYGMPGCGKTSTIYAISTEFSRDIYFLTRENMKNIKSLDAALKIIPENSIIVFEDINISGLKQLNVTKIYSKLISAYEDSSGREQFKDRFLKEDISEEELLFLIEDDLKRVGETHEKYIECIKDCDLQDLIHILFSCEEDLNRIVKRAKLQVSKCSENELEDELEDKESIINVLLENFDGYNQLHNCILILTTNFIDTLDSRLIRPGRIDHKLFFDYPDSTVIENIICHMFSIETNFFVKRFAKIQSKKTSTATIINEMVLPFINNFDDFVKKYS